MRFGANSFIWTSPFGDADLGLIEKARDMGFDLFEVAVEDPNRITISRLQSVLRAAGMAVTLCGAFGPERDLGHEDRAVRQTCLRYVRHCLEMCEALEASRFCGPIYAAVGKARLASPAERARQWSYVVENLQIVGEEAGRRGVMLGLEPLNRYETDLVNTVEQAIELVQGVGSPHVGIHLDTYHMNIEERGLPDAIRRAGRHLVHVHASANDRGIIGLDHIDWPGVRDALRDIAYDGAIVIESFTPRVKVIARAAAIWRPLAPSQDEIAREGLRFLRELFTY